MLTRSLAYSALGKLFTEPQYLTKDKNEDNDIAITAIDLEEEAAGYQAAYSRLAASETAEPDPVGYVQDPLNYFEQELGQLRAKMGEKVDLLISGASRG